MLIGLASAYLGMRRWVWAWPVGIIANVMLFFVYLGAVFGADERIPLFGQAGRQVFFIVTSIYGWWRWSRLRRLNHADDPSGAAITPRWATASERTAVVGFWLVGHRRRAPGVRLALEPAPNPYFTPEWWFFWCDAWIFVGSIVATYAMARGWNEFWLAWIGVDLVGVPSASPRATCRRPCSTVLRPLRHLRLHPVGQGLARRAARPGGALARSATG